MLEQSLEPATPILKAAAVRASGAVTADALTPRKCLQGPRRWEGRSGPPEMGGEVRGVESPAGSEGQRSDWLQRFIEQLQAPCRNPLWGSRAGWGGTQ